MLKVFIKVVDEDRKTIKRAYLSLDVPLPNNTTKRMRLINDVRHLYAKLHEVKTAQIKLRIQESILKVVEF